MGFFAKPVKASGISSQNSQKRKTTGAENLGIKVNFYASYTVISFASRGGQIIRTGINPACTLVVPKDYR